jgi:hypothetical protein
MRQRSSFPKAVTQRAETANKKHEKIKKTARQDRIVTIPAQPA